ncbi:2Fe-2S ferredoxin-type domain-containing protein [Microdochium bolleyi]|uniref:2Fe-2S ferredoxin-type domain-containing protein n=1 Tax=Microdochium bolleyi TaxID=196109 RepID=A0A136J8A8_9PEZI|nr:2Fe-2S ferredoxin-type domain-containing protein [Microdochium bolleyi]
MTMATTRALGRALPRLSAPLRPAQTTASQSACFSSSRTRQQSAFRPTIALAQQLFLRSFSTTRASQHGHIHPPKPGEELNITFVDKEGREHPFQVSKGDNLLDIAQANDLEMEGACGGSCACSTCHVIVTDAAMYNRMPEATDDENDMLDLAFGLTETSRLGCQVCMTKELDGLKVQLPAMSRNMQAADFSAR